MSTMKLILRRGVGVAHVSSISIPDPSTIPVGHLLVKTHYAAVQNGDRLWIKGLINTAAPAKSFDICGVSCAGQVIAVTTAPSPSPSSSSLSSSSVVDGLSSKYLHRFVSIYRALDASSYTLGTWGEYIVVTPNQCVLLPVSESKSVDEEDNDDVAKFSGSLVNMITPYAFLDSVHLPTPLTITTSLSSSSSSSVEGVLVTAGNSATGRAMLGICILKHIPIVSLVRSQQAVDELTILQKSSLSSSSTSPLSLILNTNSPSFTTDFEAAVVNMKIRSVFDGVGGSLLSCLLPLLPHSTKIYNYGLLDPTSTLTLSTRLFLFKNFSMQGFMNIATPTVTDKIRLSTALNDLANMIETAPKYFHTKVGKVVDVSDEGVTEAIAYVENQGKKFVFNFRT